MRILGLDNDYMIFYVGLFTPTHVFRVFNSSSLYFYPSSRHHQKVLLLEELPGFVKQDYVICECELGFNPA